MLRLERPQLQIDAHETKLAYYSVLQYEPDHMRQERINVAVLLESPSHHYRAARFLRYMHKRVRDFDPTISERVIYQLAKSLENTFVSDKENAQKSPIDYVDVPRPEGLNVLIHDCSVGPYTLWRFTDPKPLVIDAASSFEAELDKLYRRLVQPKGNKQEELNRDKDYVRKATVSALHHREVDLTLNPPPIPGSIFKENAFDASHTTTFATYLQFLSFDTYSPALDQAKAFITARRDVGDRVEGYAVEYIAVIQPPELLRTIDNREAYSRALSYFEASGIRHVRAEHDGFDLIAQGLKGDLDEFRTSFPSA